MAASKRGREVAKALYEAIKKQGGPGPRPVNLQRAFADAHEILAKRDAVKARKQQVKRRFVEARAEAVK